MVKQTQDCTRSNSKSIGRMRDRILFPTEGPVSQCNNSKLIFILIPHTSPGLMDSTDWVGGMEMRVTCNNNGNTITPDFVKF